MNFAQLLDYGPRLRSAPETLSKARKATSGSAISGEASHASSTERFRLALLKARTKLLEEGSELDPGTTEVCEALGYTRNNALAGLRKLETEGLVRSTGTKVGRSGRRQVTWAWVD